MALFKYSLGLLLSHRIEGKGKKKKAEKKKKKTSRHKIDRCWTNKLQELFDRL